MKKVVFLVVCCIYAMSCCAQQWGLRGGLNISGASTEIKTAKGISVTDDNSSSKVGFRIGIVSLNNVSKTFSFQPGLYFTTFGMKSKGSEGKRKVKEVDNLYYLQLPLLGSINVALKNPSQKFQILFGPYVAYGIGGETKITEEGKTVKVKLFKDLKTTFGKEEAILDRLDAGLSFGCGFLLNKVFLGLNYDLGLVNIVNKDVSEDLKYRNRNFTIAVGINF